MIELTDTTIQRVIIFISLVGLIAFIIWFSDIINEDIPKPNKKQALLMYLSCGPFVWIIIPIGLAIYYSVIVVRFMYRKLGT